MTARMGSLFWACGAALGAALLGLNAGGTPPAGESYRVHEWGTFTSVVGSDGRMLTGLEVEEHALPNFVHSHDGFAPRNKGWNRPVAGVTVKMETPVLYFYSEAPRQVRVAVDFRGGSISQWFPARASGETLSEGWEIYQRTGSLAPIDFSAGDFRGAAAWQVQLLPPHAPLAVRNGFYAETPQWPRARVAQANRVRAASGEVEGFIFYRGVGNFALPLQVQALPDGTLTLTNTGADLMPFVWVYERSREGVRSWVGELQAGQSQLASVSADTRVAFHSALVTAGLTADEARALIDTWRESYFDHAGLRVFWIVPRAFTDEILPLQITPQPERLERVLVGRTEVLTPAFEAQLVDDFARDGGRQWEEDRYYRAYRERVREIGSGTAVAAR